MAGDSKRQDAHIVSWLFELHQSHKDEDKKEGQSSQWDFKYSHYPCASPVGPSDTRMLQIEAIFQNVLGYPRLPPRIHSFLCQGGRGEGVTVESALKTVEGLSERYGKELVLYLLKRCPLILLERFEDLSERADITRSMLDLKPHDMYMILRKNPLLLVMEPTEARARFNRLHRITPLSHESVTTMVRKFPLALNFTSESIEAKVERLRNLAYTRTTWQQHFDNIPPSLLAFYLRDSKDLLDRLEYLALTGDNSSWMLHDVFKPGNNIFARKHPGYRRWLAVRAQRKQQQQARKQLMQEREADEEQIRSRDPPPPPPSSFRQLGYSRRS